MSEFIDKLRSLISAGEVRISEHGYDELVADVLTTRGVIAGIADAEAIEEYPDYPKGPCGLYLQKDQFGKPIHVVWLS